MKVNINAQILDLNLGEGWIDNYAAANGLAEFTKKIWEKDLEILGCDIEIEIDVEKDTGGVSRSKMVVVENGKISEYEVENLLTDENTIWERFVCSDDASEYYNED